MIEYFPFVLSLSKHEFSFFQHPARYGGKLSSNAAGTVKRC